MATGLFDCPGCARPAMGSRRESTVRYHADDTCAGRWHDDCWDRLTEAINVGRASELDSLTVAITFAQHIADARGLETVVRDAYKLGFYVRVCADEGMPNCDPIYATVRPRPVAARS